MTPELLELGHQVATDPTCRDMKIGDPPRPLTNVEMNAASTWVTWQTLNRIDRDGCCGGEISMSGRCPETGRPCPMYLKSKRIEQQVFHPKELTV